MGIESGCAYTAEALQQADKFIVDDVALAEYFDKIGRDRLTADGQPDPENTGGMPPIYATIGEIVAGKRLARDSPREMLSHLMEARGVSQIELHRSTKIAKSIISENLAGKKSFSRKMILTLAVFFDAHKSILAHNL